MQFRETRSKVRDNQRAKLYRAERACDIFEHGKVFPDIEAVQKYVNRLTTYAWFTRRWGSLKIEVRDGRGRRNAGGFRSRWGRHFITMPHWSRKEAVVLHEVAHVTTENCYAPHGREYAHNYLELVKHMMGHSDWSILKASFKKHHVRYRKETAKKSSSPISSEAMKERMARLRALRGKKKAESVVVTQTGPELKLDR